MAFPPNGTEMISPVLDHGEISGYERVSVRQGWISEPEDIWCHVDSDIPGEYEVVLSIGMSDGTTHETRSVAEFLGTLWNMCPAQFTSMRVAMAELAYDQTDRSILN